MTAVNIEKNDFACLIAHELRDSERQIDASGAKLSLLLGTIFEGRAPAGFAASAGQSGIENTTAALSAIVEARRKIVAAHNHFERDGRRMGLDWSLSGLGETKPTAAIPDRASAHA